MIHPWVGVAFFLVSGAMFFQWLADMHFEPSEREWLGPKAFEYMRYQSDDSNVGKYNGGQKLYFWSVSLGAIGLLLSGLLMWFPRAFPRILMEFGYIIHDFTVHLLCGVARVSHLSGHCRRAGDVRFDDARHGHPPVGASSPPALVPRSDG